MRRVAPRGAIGDEDKVVGDSAVGVVGVRKIVGDIFACACSRRHNDGEDRSQVGGRWGRSVIGAARDEGQKRERDARAAHALKVT